MEDNKPWHEGLNKEPCGMCRKLSDPHPNGLTLCADCQDLLEDKIVLVCLNCQGSLILNKEEKLKDKVEAARQICYEMFDIYRNTTVIVYSFCHKCYSTN